MREQAYNRAAAVAYARRWAMARNPIYHDFEHLGGDCTNFISQCVYAGAPQMNFTPDTGWFYLSLNDRAAAWTGVEFFFRFMAFNDSLGPYAYPVAPTQAQPGDVVQLGLRNGAFYHSALLLNTSPTLLIAAHSQDALDRPLSTYSYTQARFLHIAGYREANPPPAAGNMPARNEL